MLVSYLAYSSTLKMEAICCAETSADTGLHGLISQKTELFIVTAVRNSNLGRMVYDPYI
jgi:hypothetical protein